MDLYISAVLIDVWQMPRDDLLADGSVRVRVGDYTIESRPYIDSEEVARRRLAATIVMQCYTRGMFARTRARNLKAELAQRREQYLADEQRLRAEVCAFFLVPSAILVHKW